MFQDDPDGSYLSLPFSKSTQARHEYEWASIPSSYTLFFARTVLIVRLSLYYSNYYYDYYKLVLVRFDQPATLKTCTRGGVNGAAVPSSSAHPARRGLLDTSGQATLARRISSRRRRAPADTAAFSIATRCCTSR